MKGLQRHYSLEHADKVLALVSALLEAEAPPSWSGTIGVWANGREQGYYVTGPYRLNDRCPAIVFAQERRSDDVVVVPGPIARFCIQSNMPEDDVWKANRRTFHDDDEAARFITDTLLKPWEG